MSGGVSAVIRDPSPRSKIYPDPEISSGFSGNYYGSVK